MTMFGPDFPRLKRACEELRNWGRWGSDDEIGTLNFITPAHIKRASKLVRSGRVISLAMDLSQFGPQVGVSGRFNPMHYMIRDGQDALLSQISVIPAGFGSADDIFMMPTQGATHWDALSHVFWEGKMWNGYAAQLVSSSGAARNGIENVRERVVGRGVLLDIPRYLGVATLDEGYPITVADLEGAAAEARVAIGTGDMILLRTGQLAEFRQANSWHGYAYGSAPGFAFETAFWLARNNIAAVATDTASAEAKPSEVMWLREVIPAGPLPWHRVVIANMGLLVGEMFDLDRLAEACAEENKYEFLFIAPSLPLVGAVGSPVNPIAIF
jgi:kynurenine formamidase